MNSTFEIMRFTALEIVRMRAFQVLIAGARILASVYTLFVAVTLLERDIGQKVCHLFLAPPLSRFSYLTGRFLSLLIDLFLLMLVVMLTSEASLLLTLNPDGEYGRNALPWHTGFSLAGLTFYQHVSLLAAIVMIFTWATGLAEMLLFSVAILFITWIVPPIILALQSPEVVSQFPVAVAALVEAIGMILPQLNGGNIGLALLIFSHRDL